VRNARSSPSEEILNRPVVANVDIRKVSLAPLGERQLHGSEIIFMPMTASRQAVCDDEFTLCANGMWVQVACRQSFRAE
jgi:hypothetical protein